jgi:hypothetical protein
LTPLLHTIQAAACSRSGLNLASLRAAAGVAVYFAMLDGVLIAAYALWAGPRRFGITEPWPLVLYFMVAYFGTVLVAAGILHVIRVGPGLARRMS